MRFRLGALAARAIFFTARANPCASQIYVYIGAKQVEGSPVQKAGLAQSGDAHVRDCSDAANANDKRRILAPAPGCRSIFQILKGHTSPASTFRATWHCDRPRTPVSQLMTSLRMTPQSIAPRTVVHFFTPESSQDAALGRPCPITSFACCTAFWRSGVINGRRYGPACSPRWAMPVWAVPERPAA
jgi:hypothetical protein